MIFQFEVLRSSARGVSQVLHDTRQESRQEGKKGEDGEREKCDPPPLRAKEEYMCINVKNENFLTPKMLFQTAYF